MKLASTDSRAVKAYSTLEETFNKVHGDKYNYDKSIYRTARKHMTVTCPEHGDWEITPDNHKRFGCPGCDNTSKIDTPEFIRRAKLKHANRYTYMNSSYVSSIMPIKITCKLHGDFCQRPNDHLQGKGCKRCADLHKKVRYNGKHYTGIPTILYYVEIEPGIYKIGITTESVKKRFRRSKIQRIILEVYYDDGKEAYQVEQGILGSISNIGVYEALRVPIVGHTEMSLEPFLYIAMQRIKGTNYTSVRWNQTH